MNSSPRLVLLPLLVSIASLSAKVSYANFDQVIAYGCDLSNNAIPRKKRIKVNFFAFPKTYNSEKQEIKLRLKHVKGIDETVIEDTQDLPVFAEALEPSAIGRRLELRHDEGFNFLGRVGKLKVVAFYLDEPQPVFPIFLDSAKTGDPDNNYYGRCWLDPSLEP